MRTENSEDFNNHYSDLEMLNACGVHLNSQTHNSLVLDKPCFILLQYFNTSYFLCSLKTYFTITPISDYNFSYQNCYVVTTLLFTTMDPCSSCTSRTSNQHYIQSAGRISQSLLSPITIFTNLVILAFSYQNCYVVTTLLFTTPFNYYGSLF